MSNFVFFFFFVMLDSLDQLLSAETALLFYPHDIIVLSFVLLSEKTDGLRRVAGWPSQRTLVKYTADNINYWLDGYYNVFFFGRNKYERNAEKVKTSWLGSKLPRDARVACRNWSFFFKFFSFDAFRLIVGYAHVRLWTRDSKSSWNVSFSCVIIEIINSGKGINKFKTNNTVQVHTKGVDFWSWNVTSEK